MNTTQLNTTYLKRYFYHNFILFFGCFLIGIIIIFITYKKTITLNLILWEFLLIFLISSLFLGIDLFINYFYLKLKQVEVNDKAIIVDNKSINIANIISITPITYTKNNLFINVVEIELQDDKFCFLDQSQFSNSNSKSINLLLKNFPQLKDKVKDNITKRKLYKY